MLVWYECSWCGKHVVERWFVGPSCGWPVVPVWFDRPWCGAPVVLRMIACSGWFHRTSVVQA